MKFPRVFVIAEAGVNHNGDLELARQLIAESAKAGADAVKFQTFRANEIASPAAKLAEYQIRASGDAKSAQGDILRRLELDRNAHFQLAECAKREGITFLSSPFDPASVDLLEEISVPLFKLGSGEITNIPLLRHVARKAKPVMLSTGMATLDEVARAVRIMGEENNRDIILMHCVSEYPAPSAEINLRAIKTMASALGLPVGYSDHTLGNEIAWAAIALGAGAIEKHFTLSRDLPGPDHAASAEPHEFKALVEGIRAIESALGDGIKRPAPCERANRLLVRRSVFAASEIQPGSILTAAMLACRRPGTGIPSERVEDLIGRRINRAVRCGEMLDWSAVDGFFDEAFAGAIDA